jgi:hypothetical protein
MYTIEEIIYYIKKFSLTGDKVRDFLLVKEINTLYYKLVNYEKWIISKDLYNDTCVLLDEYFGWLGVSKEEIHSIIFQDKYNLDSPKDCIESIEIYLKNFYIQKYDFDPHRRHIYDSKKYLNFVWRVLEVLDIICKKYNLEWEKIEQKYTTIKTHIDKKCKDVEILEKIEDRIDVIEDISSSIYLNICRHISTLREVSEIEKYFNTVASDDIYNRYSNNIKDEYLCTILKEFKVELDIIVIKLMLSNYGLKIENPFVLKIQ